MKLFFLIFVLVLCGLWLMQPPGAALPMSAPRATLVPDVEPTPDTRPEPTPDPRDYTPVPSYPAPVYPAPAHHTDAPLTDGLQTIWHAVTGR